LVLLRAGQLEQLDLEVVLYNPALLAIGVNPKVAGATGMYLVMFSTFNACVVNSIQGVLDFKYGFFFRRLQHIW